MKYSNNFFYVIFPDKLHYLNEKIKVIILFMFLWFYQGFLLLFNIKKDSIRYNQTYISIIYNAIIKYPLLGFLPTDFFYYNLYKNNYKEYLSFIEYYGSLIRFNYRKPYLLDNKFQFRQIIKDKIKLPKLIAFVDKNKKKINYYSEPKTNKLIIKPIKGQWGNDIKILKTEKLLENLKNYSKSFIVEEYIDQHLTINKIFNKSVNSLRILTLQKDGIVKVIKIVLRVGRNSTNNLDNMTRGGISIDVDIESGKLGLGYTLYKYGHVKYLSHPDTKYKFYGIIIPYFKKAKKLAIDSHKCFPMFKLIGWDIAITESGPIVIEGNRLPGIIIFQIHSPLKKIINF